MGIKFEKKIEEATDEELYSWINTNNSHYTVLASNELIKRVLNKLQVVITVFNDQSSKQTKKMIWLTTVIIMLTIAMLIGLVVQIILVVKQTNYKELQSKSERIEQAESINQTPLLKINQ